MSAFAMPPPESASLQPAHFRPFRRLSTADIFASVGKSNLAEGRRRSRDVLLSQTSDLVRTDPLNTKIQTDDNPFANSIAQSGYDLPQGDRDRTNAYAARVINRVGCRRR